jgi:hypothetical protein
MTKRKSGSDCMLCEKEVCECITKPAKPLPKSPLLKKKGIRRTENVPFPDVIKEPELPKPDMRSAMKRAVSTDLRPSTVPRRTSPPPSEPRPAATHSRTPTVRRRRPATLASAMLEPPPAPPAIKKRMSKDDVMQKVAIDLVTKILGGVILNGNTTVSAGPLGLGDRITYLQNRLDL